MNSSSSWKVQQTGEKFNKTKGRMDLIVDVVITFVFQFLPVLIYFMICLVSDNALENDVIQKNLLITCIVANTSGIHTGMENQDSIKDVWAKIILSSRILISCLGSIVFSILEMSSMNFDIKTNQTFCMIFAGIGLTGTVLLGFFSDLRGGEIR